MSISTHKTPVDSTDRSNYAIDLSVSVPELRTKSQLNKIIVGTSSKPDHLAINIYWDTLRSWYNPNKTYRKDGNVLHIKKLKTKGIYLKYLKLSDIHGVSKETIRKKIVKLEQLGLINRSFQHKETVTTNSYNQLIIYVWRNTPYFFNTLGIDKEEITSLNPQTNHNHIATKYNIVFGTQALQNQAFAVDEGIQRLEDTKELKKPFSKEKDRSIKSNFCKNFLEEKTQTKLSLGEVQKSRVLQDFYPLNKEDCNELQSLSGRDFSLNAMNEILRDMSKRLTDRVFNSRKGFISYMSKALRYEMRDAVKTSNESFKIKANLNSEESRAEEIENYLTEIEYSTQVSPEWHLKKKLACILESTKAYNLLKAYRSIAIEGDTAKIHLHKAVQLSQGELDLILSQVKATHERFENGEYTPIQKIELIMPKVTNKNQSFNKTNLETKQLPNTLWGRVRSVLIGIYGEATYHNWFSKLEAIEDTAEKEIKLKAPTSLVQDWITQNYLDDITKLVINKRYKVSFC
jgi:hypothetical protein